MSIVSDKRRVGGPAHCGARKKTHLLPCHVWALGPQSQSGRLQGWAGETADSLVIEKLPSLA